MYAYRILDEKLREAAASVLPVCGVVAALCLLLVPVEAGLMLSFLIASALLVLGMGLFTLGSDMSMTRIGGHMGAKLTQSRKLGLILPLSFLLGVAVTVAEPDLTVLATQVPSIPNAVLIWTVAIGVGLFLVVSVLRTVWKIPLRWVLLTMYTGLILLSFFVPQNMLAVAFDSGGVTTGPITVPFIMALGLGLSAARGDPEGEADSFGVITLASIGPILAVLILGLLYRPDGADYASTAVVHVADSRGVAAAFLESLPHYAKEVLVALAPIAGVFVVFQLLTRAFKPKGLARIGVGLVYTFVGLVLFLTGVNVGFLPAGRQLGQELGASAYSWSLIPLGALLGWFIVEAEPAVHVLCVQVETVTGGAVSKSAMNRALSFGMAISVALSMARILFGIPLYAVILPGYALALGLSFVVPPMFTGIAFDSGGVASGPMTATFLLPFAMGACEALGGSILLDAFGIVALVAMTPLVTIQLMGLGYQRKMRRHAAVLEEGADEILEYDVSLYRPQEVRELG